MINKCLKTPARFDTQPQVLWQVTIATIMITGYGIVRKRLRFWVKVSTIVGEMEWLRVNKSKVNQDKLLSRNSGEYRVKYSYL